MKKFYRVLGFGLAVCVFCGCLFAGCDGARDFELVAYEKIEPAERIKAYMLADGGFHKGNDYGSAELYDTYYASLLAEIALPEYAHNYGEMNVPIEFQDMNLSAAALHNCWYYTKLFTPYLSKNKAKTEQLKQNPEFKDALSAKNVINVLQIYFALDIAYDENAIFDFCAELSQKLEFPAPIDAQAKSDLIFAYSSSMNLANIEALIGRKGLAQTEKIAKHWADYEAVLQQALGENTLDIISLDNYLFLAKQFKMDMKIGEEQVSNYVRSLHDANGGYNFLPNGSNDAFSSYLSVKIAQEHGIEIDLKALKNRLVRYEKSNGAFVPFMETNSSPSSSYYALMSLKLLNDGEADKLIENYLENGNFENEIDYASIYKLHLENAVGKSITSKQINAALLQIAEYGAEGILRTHEGELLYLLNITLDLAENASTIEESTGKKLQELLETEAVDLDGTQEILRNIALKKLGFEFDEKQIKNIEKTIAECAKQKNLSINSLRLLAYAAQNSGIAANSKTIALVNKALAQSRNGFELYAEIENGFMTPKTIYSGLLLKQFAS